MDVNSKSRKQLVFIMRSLKDIKDRLKKNKIPNTIHPLLSEEASNYVIETVLDIASNHIPWKNEDIGIEIIDIKPEQPVIKKTTKKTTKKQRKPLKKSLNKKNNINTLHSIGC